nr:PREDICTED: thioredoxin domain-containing protein 17-like [Bemisia tabaci]
MSSCDIADQKIEGYEAFTSLTDTLDSCDKSVFLLFRGSNNDKGVSWCPDCVKAEPIIKDVYDSLDNKHTRALIQVSVGNREVWKDPKCSFRTDPRLKLTNIPTIIKWKGGRIIDDECSKVDVLRKFFLG